MTWLLLVFLGVLLYTTFREKRDFFHPSRVYLLLYGFLFAVYFLKLSRFQEPWSPTTTMLFWGAVVSFLGGGLLVSYYVKNIAPVNHRYLTAGSIAERVDDARHPIEWKKFFIVTVFLFLLFSLSYLQTYFRFGVIPMFSDNPDGYRFLFLGGNLIIDLAGESGPLVIMLCAEVILLKGTSHRQRILAACMLLIAFAMYFTLVTRMPLVRTGIYVVVLYHYLRRPISFKLVLAASVLVLLFFAFGAVVRINYGGFSELAQNLRIHMPRKYILLTNPYAYAVNNIWNLDFAFKKYVDGRFAYNHSFGFEMFRPVFYYLRFEPLLQGAYNFDSMFNESIVKVRGLNSVLYIWHFYQDFGSFGVFAVSLVVGVGLHLFYYNMLLAPSPFRVAMYGLFIAMVAFSFMIPLWSFWNIYMEIAVLIITHKTLHIV